MAKESAASPSEAGMWAARSEEIWSEASRVGVGVDLRDWWDQLSGQSQLSLKVNFRNSCYESICLGVLDTRAKSLQYQPRKAGGPLKEASLKALNGFFGSALARAGYAMVRIEPEVLWQLMNWRRAVRPRFSFVFDTNALVNGTAHFLLELFADRCDLVTTSIVTKELQDQAAIYKGGSKTKEKYLAPWEIDVVGHRIQAWSGHIHPLWDRLDLDDAALLLAKGSDPKSGGKSADADTMLLRQVMRAIQTRIKGLQVMLVTSDGALAKRAVSELQEQSVVFSRPIKLDNERVYVPNRWWPGPDQGHLLSWGHPARLVWELLAVADSIELWEKSTPVAKIAGFRQGEMWMSDYRHPGVWIALGRRASTQSSAEVAADVSVDGPRGLYKPREGAETPLEEPLVYDYPHKSGTILDRNLRLSASLLFDVLGQLAISETPNLVSLMELPDLSSGKGFDKKRKDIALILKSAGIGELDSETLKLTPGDSFSELQELWKLGSRERLFRLLSVWSPLFEIANLPMDKIDRPKATIDSARSIASALGFLTSHGGSYTPGGGCYSISAIKPKLHDYLVENNSNISMYSLLLGFFGKLLNVSPSRVIELWPALRSGGLFDGIELRRGGHPLGLGTLKVIELSHQPPGWSWTKLELDSIDGYSDLLLRDEEGR